MIEQNHIHGSGLDGRPRCGSTGNRISVSGVTAFLTCPKCRELSTPIPYQEALRQLEAAAKKGRA